MQAVGYNACQAFRFGLRPDNAHAGNCIRFSTSCILCWLNTAFSIKDTHPRKEESMKNVYVKWRQPLTNLPYEYILPQELPKVVVHVLAN